VDERVTKGACSGETPARAPAWPVAGLLAGVLGWGVLEAVRAPLGFADSAIAAAGESPPPAVSLRLARLLWWQELGDASLSMGCVGAALALCFQQATHPRGLRESLEVGLTGLFLGAAAGVVTAAAFGSREIGDQDLAFASSMHGLLWAGLGLASGLSSGRSDYPILRAAILGGAAWGLAYPAAAACVSPWHHVERLMPTSAAHRAAWILGGALVVALSAHLAARTRRPAAPPSEAAGISSPLNPQDPNQCAREKASR
jgi:hypothetical protein